MIRRSFVSVGVAILAACSSFGDGGGGSEPPADVDAGSDGGAFEAGAMDASDAPDGGAVSNRVTNGLVALYRFREGSGKVIADSTAAPLDLAIQNDEQADWVPEGVRFRGTHARTADAAGKIVACKDAGEITFETWLRADPPAQSGPSRIVGLANDAVGASRLFLLGIGKNGDGTTKQATFAVRFGSGTATELFETPLGTVTGEMQHVVATAKAPGEAFVYVDGVTHRAFSISTSFAGWSDRVLSIGDDIMQGNDGVPRAFNGSIALLAVYCRALTRAEVLVNLAAGPRPAP